MTRLIEVGGVDIEAIRDQFPLRDFIGADVKLDRRGKGLCPFHAEKSPSFQIYDKDQRYHCFGCGKHGDLFDYAEAVHGWTIPQTAEQLGGGTVPTYTPDRIEEIRRRRLAIEEADKAERAKVIGLCRQAWDEAFPDIPADHPYVVAKGIVPYGARLGDGDTILTPLMGQSDGLVQCVQAIHPDGRKEFPYRGTVTGGFFVIGGKVSSATEPVLLCEGYATGCTLHAATSRVVIVSYNGGNMVEVAAFFRSRYPDQPFIVAGDDDHGNKENAGIKAAMAAADILGCEYLLPVRKEGTDATDFNDMAAQYGLDAVTDLIVHGVVPADAEDPTPEPAKPSIGIKSLTPFDPATIPVRPWVIRGWLLQRNVAMLIAPPGVGKSTITLHQAIAIATGRSWGDWTIERPGNVLLINVEDDEDEMRRRLAAALDVMGLTQADIAGKLFIHDGDREFLITKAVDNSREVVWSPLVEELNETIRRENIKVLIVDPFAETFNGQENDNNEMKRAATGFRHIARTGDCAVMLVHHTSKAAASSVGDMYAGRGATAPAGVVRTAATLFPMGEADAEKFGLPDKDRRFYVRWDDAKSNQSLVSGDARWFRKVGVDIGNATGLHESDNVGALAPWSPPDVFENFSVQIANRILDELASGTFKEDRRAKDNGDWAGCPIMRIAERSEEQAMRILKEWKRNGVIEAIKDKDQVTRHMRVFVRVNHDKRPG